MAARLRQDSNPMLVQAKKVEGPWLGQPNWSIRISDPQKKRLESTAASWNVAAQYVLYAPSDEYPWNCFPSSCFAFMHLVPSAAVRSGRLLSNYWPTLSNM